MSSIPVDDLCAQARDALRQKDAATAMNRYEQALQQNPDHIPAYEALAGLAFARKDYARAAELFQRLAALDPHNVGPLVNLGAVYNRQGKFAEASKVLRQALARDRRCAEAYFNLGFAQRGQHQHSMAVSAYKEAIRLAPEMYDAYVNLGHVLLDSGNAAQAVLNFQRALQIKPNLERARQGLLAAEQRVADAKNAISPFGRLVDMQEVARKNAEEGRAQRQLTPQERFEDRNGAHRLAKEGEQCSVAFFNQLKSELAPAILRLSKAVTEGDERHGLLESLERLIAAHDRFQKFSQITFLKLDELRAHDEKVRSLMQS